MLLLFKDIILSFVASIISSYDLVRVGDWIELPKYGANDDVIDISLTVIKVQNWDKLSLQFQRAKLVKTHSKTGEECKFWALVN